MGEAVKCGSCTKCFRVIGEAQKGTVKQTPAFVHPARSIAIHPSMPSQPPPASQLQPHDVDSRVPPQIPHSAALPDDAGPTITMPEALHQLRDELLLGRATSGAGSGTPKTPFGWDWQTEH